MDEIPECYDFFLTAVGEPTYYPALRAEHPLRLPGGGSGQPVSRHAAPFCMRNARCVCRKVSAAGQCTVSVSALRARRFAYIPA